MDHGMLPMFKKTSIGTRAVQEFIISGNLNNYSDDPNKRNALRQTAEHFKVVDGELYRHGSDREYAKYGLRVVIHDDEPQKKLDIITKAHIDSQGQHLGMNNTIKNVNQLHYWQGVSSHVKVFLKKCDMCKDRSRFNVEEWVVAEKLQLGKKKQKVISTEARDELRNLGKIKKPTPPETFFIVNAERKVDLDTLKEDAEMLIDSNNIEYVVETLGYSEEGHDLKEVCHVLNVPDIVPIPERFRSREIERFLKLGEYPEDFTTNQKCGLRGPAAQYCIIEDELYHEGNKNGSKNVRQVIHDDLPALKVKIMVECHLDDDGTHLGLNRTMNRIGLKYFWVGLSVDVRKFMLKCKICSSGKGRKRDEDNSKFLSEVEQLKEKQNILKMREQEEASSELIIAPYSVDVAEQAQAANIEPETYSQVIRLLGQNQENITEITVEVVNDEQYQAQQIHLQSETEGHVEIETEVHQMDTDGNTEAETLAAAALIEAGDIVNIKGHVDVERIEDEDYIVEENYTEDETIVDAGNYAVEDETAKEGNIVEDNVESDVDADIEMLGKRERVKSIEIRPLEDEETRNIDQDEGTLDSVNDKAENESGDNDIGNVLENVAELESTDESTGVRLVITDVKGADDDKNGAYASGAEEVNENMAVTTESDSEIEYVENEDTTGNEISSKTFMNKPSGLISYFRDIIYVPKSKKSRAMETFMKENIVTTGYTRAKLFELTKNFEMKDDVMYRRASRYKGQQICIHDDNPELKLRIIEEFHCKPNGVHFSELITVQNINYRYYWEEMKWDVKRFYLRCSTCVLDGEDLRTKKKVLNVEEKKKKKEEDKKKLALDGVSAKRNREFRERLKDKFDTFKQWNKYGKDEADEMDLEEKEINSEYEAMALDAIEGDLHLDGTVIVKQEICEEQDESDIEINIPESDDEEGVITMITTKPRFMIKLYATLDQEECVRTMFEENNWSYKLENMRRSTDEREKKKQSLGGDKDVYLLSMDVLLEQEQAIRQLFTSKGWEYSLEALQLKETSEPKKTSAIKSEIQTRSSAQKPEEKDGSNKKAAPKTRRGKRTSKQNEKTKAGKLKTGQVSIAEDEENSSLVMECDDEQTPTRAKGTKRDASELYTPITEGRRSGREVKKPRRFSPDEEDIKPPAKLTEKVTATLSKDKEGTGRPNRQVKSKPLPDTPKSTTKGSETKSKAQLLSSLSLSSVSPSPKSTSKTKVSNSLATDLDASTPAAPQKETGKKSKGSPVKVNKKLVDDEDFRIDDFFSSQSKSNTKESEGGLEADKDDESEDELVYGDDEDDYDDDEEDDDDDDEGDNGISPALKILLNDVAKETMEVVSLGDVFMCPLCDAQFLTEKQCVQHGIENDCFEECQLCGKVFKKNQQTEYMDHVLLHESGDKFPCELCDKVFFSAQHVQVHRRIHGEEKSEKCSSCPEEFYTSFQLASHMLRKHNESNMFSCDICKAKFVKISFMKSELFFDGELSFFQCVMCKK